MASISPRRIDASSSAMVAVFFLGARKTTAAMTRMPSVMMETLFIGDFSFLLFRYGLVPLSF